MILGSTAYSYTVVHGPDAKEFFRFAVLDANVVEDVYRLYRVGLEGTHKAAHRS